MAMQLQNDGNFRKMDELLTDTSEEFIEINFDEFKLLHFVGETWDLNNQIAFGMINQFRV